MERVSILDEKFYGKRCLVRFSVTVGVNLGILWAEFC